MRTICNLIISTLLITVLSSCQMWEKQKGPEELNVQSNAEFVLKGVRNLTQVAQLTGSESLNETNKYDVFGTDLGSMINFKDKTYFVFGDTFGYRPPSKTGAGGSNWRSNTLAVSSDTDPSDGIMLDKFISYYGDEAKELLPAAKVDYEEMTKIPTNGITVGDNMYLYFMSVNHWGDHGEWFANYSGMAKSEDEGETWTILEDIQWPGESNFIQVSPYTIKVNDELSEIYFWSIPAGRYGNVQLMKVDEKNIVDLNEYQYYTGIDSKGNPIWSKEMDDAAFVLDGYSVGELSVIWNPYLDRWIMTYLKEGTGIVIREGLKPWGPWSEEMTLVSMHDYPGLYGPYMNPKFMEDDGKTIYFTLSLWEPYNVFWMKATLEKQEIN
jgi:hypothetical protein